MGVKYICIEIRENLRCANVFLQFTEYLSKTDFLKINVQNNKIEIKEPCNCTICIKLDDYFTLDTRSLTNLTVEECNASFRLSIGESHLDKPCSTDNVKDTINFAPLLDTKDNSNIHCSNCKVELFSTGTVVRIREFPTGAVDTSEFFCHAATDFKNLLIPNIYDLFYGLEFIIINPDLLNNTIKTKESHLYCRRCLQYLGEELFNGKAFKLWTNVLRMHIDEDDGLFKCIAKPIKTSQLLQKIVNDCSDINEPLHSIHFSKVLLETTMSNRKSKFLMIQILEKKLNILRNVTPLEHIDHNNNSMININLENWKCFKILYRPVEESNDKTKCPALLQYWQQDISIQSLKISLHTFTNLLTEIEENSMLLPEFYRYSNDDFKISYVFYKE